MIVALCFYLRHVLRRAPDGSEGAGAASAGAGGAGAHPLGREAGLAAAGLIGVLLGARLFIDGAIDLAAAFAVPEVLIGVTLVAIGTSLPELAAAVSAAAKKRPELAAGNIVGSNIFNLLGVLGAAALARPLDVPAQIAALDLWVLLAATLALGWALLLRPRLGRVCGRGTPCRLCRLSHPALLDIARASAARSAAREC